MPLYTFKLEKFHIDNTRSRHEDTDEVTFGLQAGGQRFPVQSFSAGDVNNGDHAVNLMFGPVFSSDSASPIIFSYQIYNGDSSKLRVSLAALNNDLASQALTFMQQKIEQGNPADYTDFPSNDNPDKKTDDNVPFNDGSWIQFLELWLSAVFFFPIAMALWQLVQSASKKANGIDSSILRGAPPTHTAYNTQDRTRLQDAVAIQTTQ